MDARFYNSEEIDFEKLATDLENMFRMQGYEVQHFGNNDQMMVQLKKGGDLIALIGLQTALSVTFQRTSGGSAALVGAQKWVDKAAVGAVGLIAFPVLWPLMITAGAGAVKQAALSNQVLGTIDSLVMQQVPGTHGGPMPGTLVPQFQQYWGTPPTQYMQAVPVYMPTTPQYMPNTTPVYTPPAPAQPRCPTCNTNYDPGDTFCTGCGRALTPPKRVCTSCKTEVKPGVAFCPSCGASTFQATQSQPARPAPPAPKPVAPTYTPPKPSTPVYKPPTTPTYTPPKPPTPVYTPPKPSTPVYTPPPKPPEPQPYVPPQPQEPPMVPQPSITLIPGKPRPAAPAPPPPPVPVYTPINPVQPPTAPQSPPVAPTIQARPNSQPASDAHTTWGILHFSNGREWTLAGERVLVGRYDHDLGGVEPEIDLGTMEGADTVSRAHATIEHIGSSYQLIDLGSTNFTRLNTKRLDANVPTPINDGDTLQFGKITCTFKKM